jgi:hypothetical protein
MGESEHDVCGHKAAPMAGDLVALEEDDDQR